MCEIHSIVTTMCAVIFQGKGKGRNISGYIVFAAEYRKEIAGDNPDLNFGEISKIVGAKVRS